MFRGFYNLTSGMLTQGRMLDVISNNASNTATHGFKNDRFLYSTFREVMWNRVGNDKKHYTNLTEMSFITAPSELKTEYLQGSFDETGLPLDFGIEGDGFFAVERADGIAYTRNGSFSLDDDGYLTLPGQGFVLDTNYQPIQLITDKIDVDRLGDIYFQENRGYLGSLGVFVFPDNDELDKDDQGMFFGEGAQPVNPGDVTIHHGMTERANVDWAQEMSQMIACQRAYQSAAEIIKIYDDLINRTATEVGRA